MITLEEARAQNDRLQEQGHRLLDEFEIEKLFGRYGRYEKRGSFVYGLMVGRKPDIDGTLFMDEPGLSAVMELATELLAGKRVQRVAVENGSLVEPERGLENWYVLQAKVRFEDVMWNLDLHCVEGTEANELENMSSSWLNEEQRNTALLIKAQLAEEGFYPGSSKIPGSFASVDIYRAVLEDGVKTVEEMKNWGSGRKTALEAWTQKH